MTPAWPWLVWVADNHPFLLAVLYWTLLSRVRTDRWARQRLTKVIASTGVAIYLLIVAWYVYIPQYSDHAEPSVAAVSWVVGTGGSPYHASDGPTQYAFPYGPLVYLANALVLGALGPGIGTSKILGVSSALGSLLIVAWLCRRRGRSAATALVWLTAGYLAFRTSSFWVRPEPLVLVLCALLLIVLTDGRCWYQATVAGVAAGLGTATKVNVIMYLVPGLVVLGRRHGSKGLIGASVSAGTAFALVFLVSGIRIDEYMRWAGSAVSHGFRWRSLPAMTEWALLLSAAPVASLLTHRRARTLVSPDALARIAFVTCAIGSVTLATKRGTGAHHFLPFLPTLAFLESCTPDGAQPSDGARLRILYAVLAALATIAVVEQVRWIPAAARAANPEAVAEIRTFEARYGGPLAVGYGPEYRLSFLRPVAVFDGQPYSLDAVSLMDRQIAGRPVPPAVVASIRQCRMHAWLVPRGGAPFELPNAYDPAKEVFGKDFRDRFETSYRLVEHGTYFDVWVCRQPTVNRER
jgi:hypothetical protein